MGALGTKPMTDVHWCLPLKVVNGQPAGGYRKRPFTKTTQATALLIEVLADTGCTWNQMLDMILHSQAAKQIAQTFIDAGLGDYPAHLMIATQNNPPAIPT